MVIGKPNLVEEEKSGSSDGNKDETMQGYINANYLNGLIRGFSNKSLIACQSPIEKTLTKFWQMIWENKCPLIVMVCPFEGARGEECINYWKELKEVGESVIIGEIFTLTLLKVDQVNTNITHRQFELKCKPGALKMEKQNSGPFEQSNDVDMKDESEAD